MYHLKSKEIIEYPETTPDSQTSIAYILHMELTDKSYNPACNFAYSAGKPSGQSKGHFTKILLDQDGQPVLCLVDYSTYNSCSYNLQEATLYTEKEQSIKTEIQQMPTKAKHGQKSKQTCQGRIVIRQMQEKQYICCEHYSCTSHKHFILYPDRGGGFNFEYLCALVRNDELTIKTIELGAYKNGYGLLAPCTTVHNFSSQKVNCDEEEPTLTHVHPFLANLDHIVSYIHTEIKACLPNGTGWDGVQHMKSKQDEEGSTPYIREMKEISWQRLKDGRDHIDDSEDEDGPLEGLDDDCFKLIICMLLQCSEDLLKAKYVQSDISFKHVPGWKEFELVSVDHETNQGQWCTKTPKGTSSIDTCICLPSMIIKEYCTGPLTKIEDRQKDIAQELAHNCKDLHEMGRSVSSLGPYEHIHQLYRSEREGGVSNHNWIYNKIHSKFALQGMCWERSFIPLSIWQAGDAMTNAVKMSHIDIYREGMPCSLVGGISGARYYDKMCLQTHRVMQKTGVKAVYRPTTTVVSVIRKYKRTVIQQTRKFNMADKHINEQNERLRKSWERYQNTVCKLAAKPTDLKAIESHEKQKVTYEKQKQKSLDMKKKMHGQSSG
ncbi:uncharacterized protein EV420DRAFT_1488854 [Desarmillaria tabescens]|uniref:Uncharacterized protein n=1 Tax=Armillaria tabescens TaxID=1929756 RepID=A0AA39J0L6_ARMTA|nr:uncharacterized protein EV420DRAFT_1488854 [Desarmillaria tabescens]KAK0433926.1 hypothetical protein EV420DRAFT_1488854 [Desarmillaria tabescens]